MCTQSCPTLWNSMDYARLHCPWNFPGKNTGLGCHFLLQGIFLTQGSNPSLLHWQEDSLPLRDLRSLSYKNILHNTGNIATTINGVQLFFFWSTTFKNRITVLPLYYILVTHNTVHQINLNFKKKFLKTKVHHVGTNSRYPSWDQTDNCYTLAPDTLSCRRPSPLLALYLPQAFLSP